MCADADLALSTTTSTLEQHAIPRGLKTPSQGNVWVAGGGRHSTASVVLLDPRTPFHEEEAPPRETDDPDVIEATMLLETV